MPFFCCSNCAAPIKLGDDHCPHCGSRTARVHGAVVRATAAVALGLTTATTNSCFATAEYGVACTNDDYCSGAVGNSRSSAGGITASGTGAGGSTTVSGSGGGGAGGSGGTGGGGGSGGAGGASTGEGGSGGGAGGGGASAGGAGGSS